MCREGSHLEAEFEDVLRVEKASVEGFPVVVSAMFVELSGFVDVVRVCWVSVRDLFGLSCELDSKF